MQRKQSQPEHSDTKEGKVSDLSPAWLGIGSFGFNYMHCNPFIHTVKDKEKILALNFKYIQL